MTARTLATRLDETRGALRAGRRHDPARLRRDVEILAELAAAVAESHERGVLHLGLRPEIVPLDEEEHPSLPAAAPAGLYRSPEQAVGDARKIGPTTDVWALGAILYEVLTGEPPFTDAEAIARADADPARARNRHAPEPLEAVCVRALGKHPFQRYRGALAFEQDLRRWLRGEEVAAPGASRFEVSRRWARRRRGLVAAAIAIAAIAMFVLGWLWSRGEG